MRALCAGGPALRSLLAPAGFGKTTAVHAAASGLHLRRPAGAGGGHHQPGRGRAALGGPGGDHHRPAAHRPPSRPWHRAPWWCSTRCPRWPPGTPRWCSTRWSAPPGPSCGAWAIPASPRPWAPGAWPLRCRPGRRGRHRGPRPGGQPPPAPRRRPTGPGRAAGRPSRGQPGHAHRGGLGARGGHPLATREAMAEAVVADVDAHGPEAVVALAVSHADCEDLADRIRSRLLHAGHIGGRRWRDRDGEAPSAPTPPVTGCCCTPSRAQPGLHNGSVGTVVAVESSGPAGGLRRRRRGGVAGCVRGRPAGRRQPQPFPRLGADHRGRAGRHLGGGAPAGRRLPRRPGGLHRPEPGQSAHPHLEHPAAGRGGPRRDRGRRPQRRRRWCSPG